MTEPTVDVRRCVCWCPTCFEAHTDDPSWSAAHHQATGHVTHRRSWMVETFGEAHE